MGNGFIELLDCGAEGISKAREVLIEGNLLVLPTETVYGLAARADNFAAVEKIYRLKNRPSFNPLIAHGSRFESFFPHGNFSNKAADFFAKIVPAPVSIVVKRNVNSNIATNATGGLETQAFRVPNNKLALEVLEDIGFLVVAPSANKSNGLSPTRAKHVIDSFFGSDNFLTILDGGNCEVGVESTIVDFSRDKIIILRAGGFSIDDVRNIVGEEVYLNSDSNLVMAPGMLKKHYSPDCKLVINKEFPEYDELFISFASEVAYENEISLSEKGDFVEAATKLYDVLWQAQDIVKQKNLKGISVASVPQSGLGIAINDRLLRAAYSE